VIVKKDAAPGNLDQLVLAQGLKEGNTVPVGLAQEDYTERKDVDGIVLMISASVGF
jgi:hypothetical protein